MKLIHLSDLHLGKRVNEYSMLEDQEYILKKIINVIDDEKPDGVIIAGDVYDKSIPSAEAVQLFDDFLVQLTNLIPDILKMVDEGRIALTPAVELSYLNNHEQEVLNEIMSCDELTPSLSQAQRLRKLSEDYTLTDSGISQIMSEIKGNQKEYLKIEVEPLRWYFPPGTTAKQMQTTMIRAMEFYRQHTQNRADKSKEREER